MKNKRNRKARQEVKFMKILQILLLAMCFLNLANGKDNSPSIKIKHLTHNEIEASSVKGVRKALKIDPHFQKNYLYFSNFPTQQKLAIVIKRPLTEIPNSGFQFEMDENGHVFGEPFIVISSRGFLPGERVTLNFYTEDKKLLYEDSFIPNPIVVRDSKGKKRLVAELMMVKPAFYKLELFGVRNNEKLTLKSISGNEKNITPINYRKTDGIAVSPDTVTEKGGVGQYNISNGKGEPIEFILPWGAEFAKYLLGEKIYRVNDSKEDK